MTIAGIEKEYLKLLQEGNIPTDERLALSKGLLPDGTPTPPRVLARLFLDQVTNVREEARKSILRLREDALSQIASDNSTHQSLLLFLAKHFNKSPVVGTSIIANKNTTEKILYYLQGRGNEIEDESDKGPVDRAELFRDQKFDDFEIGEEVDIEVSTQEEIVLEVPGEEEEVEIERSSDMGSLGRTPSRDVPKSGVGSRAGKDEVKFEFVPEKYTDRDMEVIIELEETDDFDEEEEILIGEDTAVTREESGAREIIPPKVDQIGIIPRGEDQIVAGRDRFSEMQTPTEEEKREFASTVDRIEDKVGDIFDIDLGDAQGGGSLGTAGAEVGIDFEAERYTSGFETSTEGHETAEFGTSTDFPKWDLDDRSVKMDREKMEVSLASDRFVTRLPMGKYIQKVSPFDLIVRSVKIFIPVAVFLLICFIIWATLPKGEASIEEYDSGINRILVEIKKEGFNSKLKNPFPEGAFLSNWETVKTGDEVDFDAGDGTSGGRRLREDLANFKTKYTRELEYDGVTEDLAIKKRSYSRVSKRLKAIDKELFVFNEEKGSYFMRFGEEGLKRNVAIEERDKEIGSFKESFNKEKSKIEKIEKDIADAKERIAEFERYNVPTEEDHGYYANKLELEELTKEYRKLKPMFDRLQSNYDGAIKKLEDKYNQRLSAIDRIEIIDKEVSKLKGEKIQLDIEKRIYGEEMEELENRRGKLEKAKASGEKITSEGLPIFLVMSNYIKEHEKSLLDEDMDEDEGISFFEKYMIKQKEAVLTIAILNKDGKEEKRKYSTTLMRMITKKKFLLFEWDINTTKWVLTSISEIKK
ncbi:MAG: hypothetical protein JW984_00670 [Deltaproteobacteria bacterium]|uniref:Uncharacterized protein n=1 Tax=Candidatus Zymogenus saltonus TaxID=2844893 RepID=A0A9D8KDP0_9DELT|nr:hypothetical protein [Candidatus Zymogenus saltonus]